MDTSINKILKEQIGYLLDIEVEQNPTLQDHDFGISDRRIIITEVVAQAWKWLHQEKKLLIMRSFQYTGLALQPDGSSDSLVRIKDLLNLIIGDQTVSAHSNPTYGLDCNLGVKGKTGVGEINYEVNDEVLIEEDFYDKNLPQVDEEYVLESETVD